MTVSFVLSHTDIASPMLKPSSYLHVEADIVMHQCYTFLSLHWPSADLMMSRSRPCFIGRGQIVKPCRCELTMTYNKIHMWDAHCSRSSLNQRGDTLRGLCPQLSSASTRCSSLRGGKALLLCNFSQKLCLPAVNRLVARLPKLYEAPSASSGKSFSLSGSSQN